MSDCNALVGKFIIISQEDHYRIGLVTGAVGEEFILIRIFPQDPNPENIPAFSTLQNINTLDCPCGECMSSQFFDSREEMNAWLAWAAAAPDDEGKLKIVNINTKH